LAATWSDALEIRKLVGAHPKQRFMVAQTRRFTDQVQAIRAAVQSGQIGELDMIRFDHRVNYTGGGYRQRLRWPVLEDMICHHLDALRYITGREAESVFVEAWNPSWSVFTGEASNTVLATMQSGLHVNYFGSWTARGQLNNYDGLLWIMGSDGSLELETPDRLMLYPTSGRDTGPARADALAMPSLAHREVDGVIDHFLGVLDHGGKLQCDIDDNLKTFAFNWAVREAARHRIRIEVAPFLEQTTQ